MSIEELKGAPVVWRPLLYDASLSTPADQMEAWTVQADVDCDLVVTSLDAALILQAAAGVHDLRA